MTKEKHLKDIADKVISLKEALFPKDKTNCPPITLNGPLIIKRKKGCIFKCANWGKYVEIKYSECTIEELVENKMTGEKMTVLPCTALDLKKSGESITPPKGRGLLGGVR